jgi:hypothetical protein
VLPDVVTSVVRKAPLTPEKVAFAWRMAVGARVDGATQVELRNGTLHVRATQAGWLSEIEHSAAVIRSRMEVLLGPGVLRFIKVATP